MINPAEHDYILYHGSDFEDAIVLYSDDRVKRWRGTYDENFLYKIGEACVNANGEAFVSILEGQHDEPGSEEGTPFWSPVARFDAAGYTFALVCNPEGVWGGFTITPAAIPAAGELHVTVPHTEFAAAPTSAHWYLKMTSEGGAVSYPIRGTMLFRQP